MKPLILTNAYPTLRSPEHGIFIFNQVKTLRSLDVNPYVVLTRPWLPSVFTKNIHRLKSFDCSPISEDPYLHFARFLPLSRGPRDRAFHRFRAHAIREVVKSLDFDLVHSNWASHDGFSGLSIARERGCPFVLTLHGYDVDVFPNLNSDTRSIFSEAVTKADRVLAVSDALARQTYKITNRRPDVLPIGVDFSRFQSSQSKASARTQLSISPDARVILFVGNLTAEKGVLDLIKAFECLSLKDALLVLVGDGPLRHAVQGRESIRATGRISQTALPNWYRAADLFVLPSHREGLGQVLLEAVSCGTSVIGSNVGGIPEVITDPARLFLPKDIDSIVRVIHYGLQTPLSQKEIDETRNKFDVRISSESLVLIYKNLLTHT